MPKTSESTPVWAGKPWILPDIMVRTILVLIVAALVIWLEFKFNLATVTFLGLQVMFWTGFLFLVAWLLGIGHLLLLRASNEYVLRNDSLEVTTGIVATKSFVIVPAGFSDLQVNRSVSGRIVGYGDVIIRSQSESDIPMVKVRDPAKVAQQIRMILGRPIVRMESENNQETLQNAAHKPKD